MEDRGQLTTEQRNPHSCRLDRLSISEAFDLINNEDASIAAAVAAARADICRAIDLVVDALQSGGRLIYVGAGTSGRLGVLDATECPPTFLTDPKLVQGVIAGGSAALTRSVEGAEDAPADAATDLDKLGIDAHDVVFGIATGGTTPYVHAAINRAKQCGARTVFLACVPATQVADRADVSIRVVTGPEVVTGSTRMKAGTATKMVLNMVSTIAMVRLGKVYENLMVDVHTRGNGKLVDRGIRMLRELTGQSRDDCAQLLDAAAGRVKTALVMDRMNLNREDAERQLEQHGGHVGRLLDEHKPACTGEANDCTCRVG